MNWGGENVCLGDWKVDELVDLRVWNKYENWAVISPLVLSEFWPTFTRGEQQCQ